MIPVINTDQHLHQMRDKPGINMSKKLRSILDQLLYRKRPCTTYGYVSQGHEYPATAISKVGLLGHGYSVQQGLHLLRCTSSKPNWTNLSTKMVNNIGGTDKVQQPLPGSTTAPRRSIAQWARWFLGAILSLMLPFWMPNGGKLQRIEEEAEMVIEGIENVAEVVERVAIVAEKISEEVADGLPDKSKLKDTILWVESVSKVAAQDAQLTIDLIHKVDALKQDLGDLETMMEPSIKKNCKA